MIEKRRWQVEKRRRRIRKAVVRTVGALRSRKNKGVKG
jgi:hypothetical protein